MQIKNKSLVLIGFFYVTSFILFQNFSFIEDNRKDFQINDSRCIVSNQSNQNVDSIIDYMNDNERAAFQCALDNGAQELDLEDYNYRIDGTITLPKKGVLIFGQKWSIQRGPRINDDPLFIGNDIAGPVEFRGEV